MKYVVFGTGMSAFSLLRSFPELDILFFLDNSPEKQYTLYNNKPVLPPGILGNVEKENFLVIVASEFHEEISAQLLKFGLVHSKNFLFMRDLLIPKTDCFLISYMKCGRTWLRFIIGSLIEHKLSIQNDDKLIYTDCYSYSNAFPIITAYHDDSPHLKSKNELSKDKKEYLTKKIIFLVRDPRDVAVSLFYHMKYRSKRYFGEIDDFVLNYVPSIVEYYNIWLNCRSDFPDFFILKYEDLRNQTVEKIKQIGEFTGFGPITDYEAKEIAEKASFANMRKYEAVNESKNLQLSKEFAKSENARKIRQGKVGGFRDELSSQTVKTINKYLKKHLEKYYGYGEE